MGSRREISRENNTMATMKQDQKGKKTRTRRGLVGNSKKAGRVYVRTAASHGRQSLTRKGLRVGLTSDTPCCADLQPARRRCAGCAGCAGLQAGVPGRGGRHTHLSQNFKRPGWPAGQVTAASGAGVGYGPGQWQGRHRNSAAKSERLRNTALGSGRDTSIQVHLLRLTRGAVSCKHLC